MTERVYTADVARGCVRNPLQPIMLPKARNSAIQAWLALSASCWEDVDNGLKDKYIEIQAAYAWILDGWFSTTLKIRETYMTNKICPRQLPRGTPQSISKLLEEFWLMRTRWGWQERKDEIHFVALPTTPMSVSNISCVLLQWRAAEAKHTFKKTLWKQFSKAVVRHLNVNL